MKQLLLLDDRYHADTQDMWRAAVKAGWQTQRTDPLRVAEHVKGYDKVRYYGNTIHAERVAHGMPLTLDVIPEDYLADLRPYTKREITLMRFADWKQPLEKRVFAKPSGNKWFARGVYDVGATVTGSTFPDDKIYLSEVVKYTDEVRCFTVDDQLLTSSLYMIDGAPYTESTKEPEELNFDRFLDDTPLRQFVREIRERCPLLPRGVVMDFGLVNGEWNLIEFNEAWACGLYYCKPDACLKCVIASQTDHL